jgi:2-methylaconitate cis-trans-isomerase PrpF
MTLAAMEVPMRTVSLVLAILAFALALVTAAVTVRADDGYRVVITNKATGNSMVWRRRTWPSQDQCGAAIKGVNTTLASIALMKFGPQGEIIGAMIPAPDADDELAASIDALLTVMVQNTGTFPNLSVSCESSGDPA